MTTLTDMINEVSMNLSGYTLQQDRATHITSAVAATASTSGTIRFTVVAAGSGLPAGITASTGTTV